MAKRSSSKPPRGSRPPPSRPLPRSPISIDAGDTTGSIHHQTLVAPESARGPARLVMLIGPEPGHRYPLDEAGVVLGRSDDCDICIEDVKISRRHARIGRTTDRRWFIEDLGSRNGTVVNGEVIQAKVLELGDRIQLSQQTVLLFTRADPMEDVMLHRQQMEVIGQLAAGIAHDFNNLLHVVIASAQHLSELAPETTLGSAEVADSIGDIAAASGRAFELTKKLLGFARRSARSAESYEPVDVGALCEDVLTLARRTFGKRIEVRSELEPGLFVRGDAAGLHQLLMNLCINARDAMPKGGVLRIEARLELSPEPDPRSPWQPGPQIVIAVIDTGVGMDEATRQRVFEPFFTTKEKGTGSGLGLATVYEVATAHGGFVEVQSELGKGARFVVRLPADMRESKAKRRDARNKLTRDTPGSRQHGTILVVDDQDLVRRSLFRILKRAGHEVWMAADGVEAIEMYAKAPKAPDVVLLDLDMPRLSGLETLGRLRGIDPGARVIVISGYHDESRRKELLGAGAIAFLPKPIESSELREMVLAALRQPRAQKR